MGDLGELREQMGPDPLCTLLKQLLEKIDTRPSQTVSGVFNRQRRNVGHEARPSEKVCFCMCGLSILFQT